MTSPWHVTDAQARRYAEGIDSETDAWSLEKHVERCTPCATRVSAAVRAGGSGPSLASVRAHVLGAVAAAPPPVGAAGRKAAAAGATGAAARETEAVTPATTGADAPHPATTGRTAAFASGADGTPALPLDTGAGAGADASATATASPRGGSPAAWGDPRRPALSPSRLWWAVGPALRGAWVLAVVLVVAGAFGLGYGAGVPGARGLLLALSPALPLLGVGLSYGRHADPLYEIAAATPSGGLRLLLTRTAAVLAVCVPLLTLGGALLPAAAGTPGAAAWLLPGLALTLAALALGSFIGCRTSSAVLGGGWLLAVADPFLGSGGGAPEDVDLFRYFSGPATQSAWAAAALACAALLVLRRRSFDHLETR
ncbi:zf-HC2 domain-containing protein [Streptomyces sp. NPDC056144]|uniref:zf-HC2 domain-containing protein n=1 Tax=unclassified Streptomyces TaxID=2593676 RepID=UPI0035DC2212